jgi:hypothetical protein
MVDMKEAIHSTIARMRSAWEAWSQVPQTSYNREEVWFAGLAVAPAEFSNQLSKLQNSLQREGAPSPISSPTTAADLTRQL